MDTKKSMSVSTRASDPQAALTESSAGLLRELVAHLRQNRTQLREEWARRITRAELLTAMTEEEIFAEATAVYDNYVEALETGTFEALQAYSRRLSERIIPRGVETDEVVGIVLLLRDVLARSLFNKYQDNVEKLNRILDSYEPAANRIANTVAVGFVEERERIIRQQQEAIRELSTPVLQVRERLLILPIIGVIDPQRARQLTEQLLRAIRANRAKVVVIDVTGVGDHRRRPERNGHGRRPAGRYRRGGAVARRPCRDARAPSRSRTWHGTHPLAPPPAPAEDAVEVPILRQGQYLIASIQSALTDADLSHLREALIAQVGRSRCRGVIVDVTALDVMDSFAVRTLRDITHMARLRGAETVIVGIQPDVAFAMVQLGLTLKGVATVLDLEEGLAFLDGRTKERVVESKPKKPSSRG